MGDKYEFLVVTFSRYGFRDHRESRFRIRVTYPDGTKRTFYYENLPDLRKFAII